MRNSYIRSIYLLLFMIYLPLPCLPDVVIADAVKWTHRDGPGIAEIIVDNSEPFFFVNRIWNEGQFPGGYQDNYIFTEASDESLKTAYWMAEIPIAGEYDVFVFYTSGSNRYFQTRYRIEHVGGFSQKMIDQTKGGNWEHLGRYNFSQDNYMVQISNRISEELVEDIDIDNGDPLFSTSGSWTTGTLSAGFNDDYLYAVCSSTSSSIAVWDIPLFVGGNYEILSWFSTGSNRNNEVPYQIFTGSGMYERIISQNAGENGWRSLGTYHFDTGHYQVIVNNIGSTDKVVIADAIRAHYPPGQGAIAPEVYVLKDDYPTPKAHQPFPVRAFVLSCDEISTVCGQVRYPSALPVEFPLYDDGMHEDESPGDSIYGGMLSAGEPATVLEYKICASTVKGAVGCSQDYKCLVAYDQFTSPELRFIFAHQIKNPEDIDSLLTRVRYGNFNTVCVVARGSANSYYNSSYEPWAIGIPEGFDPLGYLVEKAHDTSEGNAYIHVHPYVMVYWLMVTGTLPPEHILSLHPEWTSENYDGITLIDTRMYIDQGIPKVQDYLIKVFMEIVENYDIDGLNLDFIRYREQNFGYNPIALKYFHRFTGRSDRPAIDDPQWCEWRRNQVTNLVKRLYANILKVKPHILLSIDGICWEEPNEESELNHFYWNTFQDWPLWLSNQYLDAVVGMAYRCEDDPVLAQGFDDWLDYLLSKRENRLAVPIVGAYQNYIQHSLVQLHRIRQSGANWLGVFSDSSVDKLGSEPDAFYSAARSQIFPTPVNIPDHPWKKDKSKSVLMGKVKIINTPQPLMKVSLGSQGYRFTDLCGFYVFFDAEPGDCQINLYNKQDKVIYTSPINLIPGEVLEHDIIINTSCFILR